MTPLTPTTDEAFMALALEQARNGQGRTFPNPCVGCVIVHEGRVVGQGYHRRAGEPHAEVVALASLEEGIDPSRCTLYVTLEPCCMQGRTPACTSAIERAGIRRVVIGAVDPDPRVHGKGVALLKALGVEVVTGVSREACERLIRGFAKRTLHGMPWVIAKWAMSLDGKIAASNGESMWITSEEARFKAHQLRDRSDAILVGKNTAIADDPRLTCRIEDGHDPVRVVLDASLEVPLTHAILQGDTSRARTIVFAGEHILEDEALSEKKAQIEAQGVAVELLTSHLNGETSTYRLALDQALSALAAHGICTVMVEGGGALLGALRDARHIDEIHAFIAPKIIGGARAPGPLSGLGADGMKEVFSLEDVTIDRLDSGDLHIHATVPAIARRFVTSW